MHETVNASAVMPCVEPVLLLEVTRNGRVVLDDFTVVIDHPQRAIRTVAQGDRMTPPVTRCGEFRFLLTGCAANGKRRSVCLDQSTMDEIARRLAREILAVEARQRVIA